MIVTRFMATLVLLATLLGLHPVLATQDLRADIAASNARFVRGWQMHDASAMADAYEPQGRYISVDGEIVGRANLERRFARRIAHATLLHGSCTTQHLEQYTASGTATETGLCDYTIREGGRIVRIRGHYVTVWAYDPARKRWFIRFNVIPDR